MQWRKEKRQQKSTKDTQDTTKKTKHLVIRTQSNKLVNLSHPCYI